MDTGHYDLAMDAALQEAKKYEGATAPNPPVGAAALDSTGKIIAIAAHQKAGCAHAEVNLFQSCNSPIHTVAVTLEPCCYHGKTPPCTDLLIRSGVKRVIVGAIDPNPRVAGEGLRKLKEAGIEVIHGVKKDECDALIAPFKQWILTKTPYVVIKRAFTKDGSMIPPPGQKTFTTPQALVEAHRLRKTSDAIITGSGTVMADDPLFTVRHMDDHPGKVRHIIVMDRRGRVPDTWLDRASERGFCCSRGFEIDDVLIELGTKGVLKVLIEAGPSLSSNMLNRGLWHENIVFHEGEDRSTKTYNHMGSPLCLQESSSN